MSSSPDRTSAVAPLALTALGVVFGDIGTSPLYAMRECFYGSHGVPPTPDNVLGVLSLIVYSLILVISVKYVAVVMRADNQGEGGILALMSLVPGSRRWLVLMGIFGAALLYGDGMITPAISILSAVEGLEAITPVLTPAFTPYVLPITIAILIVVFTIQQRGSAGVGVIFGPITLIWFLTLATLGISQIARQPQVLEAVNPLHAVIFFMENGARGFLVLGSVVLVVTGGESLYADMGHFGRRPIRLTWFTVVLPSLLLNYFGQGALLLSDPTAAENPFFLMAPRWALLPLVILTTMATAIASQAVISGAFSLTMQAVQFGYLPRVDIEHTSAKERGQIYIPALNWSLMIACIVLVLVARSSSNLAAAYGVAVTTTMVVTTVLFYVVARERWKWAIWIAGPICVLFLAIDVAFWSANLLKVPRGGWFPLVVAAFVFVVMTTWKSGRRLLANRMAASSLPWDFFMADVAEAPPHRVPGTAIFMYGNPDGTPPALLYTLQHFRVLHEQVVVLRVETEEVPHVRSEERIEAEALEEGFYRIGLHYGFMENPSVPDDLARLSMDGLDLSPERTTFFLGRETLIAVRERVGMHVWRDRLFAYMARNARPATSFFKLPSTQVVELGAQIEI